jgi:uncharacterized protein YkwD
MARYRLLPATALLAVVLVLATTPAQAGSRGSMVRAINAVRGGAHRLINSRRLSVDAERWARHLVRADRLAHSAQAIRSHQGEVIEWHLGPRANVGRVLREWLHSATHRPVLLNRIWRHVGVGRVVGRMSGRRSTIWVVRFAR